MTLIGENKRLTFREEKGFERRFRKKAPVSATLSAALPPGQCPAQGPPPTTGWGVRTRGPRAAGRGRVGVGAPTPGTAGGSGRSGEKAAPRGPRGGPGPLPRGSLDKETQGGWPRDVEAYRGDASTTQGTPRTDPPPEARRVGSPGEPGPADTWLRARAVAAPLSSARRAGLCRGARGAAPHPQAPARPRLAPAGLPVAGTGLFLEVLHSFRSAAVKLDGEGSGCVKQPRHARRTPAPRSVDRPRRQAKPRGEAGAGSDASRVCPGSAVEAEASVSSRRPCALTDCLDPTGQKRRG